MSSYILLSLDGGGIRGVITTRLMSWVERQLQDLSGNKDARLVDYFDFFAGTSTGGLMASCYLMPDESGERPKYSAHDVEELYLSLGDKIFSLNLWQKVSRGHGMASAKYPSDSIENILMDYFGDLKLSELLRPCLITSYDMRANRQMMFRRHRAYKSDDDNFYVRDVCRATTSAPTYFEPYLIKSLSGTEYFCIDGGIFGPNPALFAYSELRRLDNNARASNMLLLSFGTGNYLDSYEEKEVKGWGKLEWYRPMVNLMSSNSIYNADSQIRMVFRDSSRNYVRVDPELTEKELSSIDLVSKDNLGKLQNIADNYITHNKDELEIFVERIYNRRQRRPINPFDELIDVKVERHWLKEYPPGSPHRINPYIYSNLNQMLDESSRNNSEKVAFEQFGNRIKYKDAHRYSESFAAYLQNVYQVNHGSRVAIMMPNCPQYPISIYAILKLGAAVVNVNPLYTADEILYVLKEISPSVVIAWDGCSLRIEEAINKWADVSGNKDASPEVIFTSLGDMLPSYKSTPLNLLLKLQGKIEKGKVSGSRSFMDALSLGQGMNLYRPEVRGEDIAFLQMTGGTTGKPKAAMLSHSNLISNILQVKAYVDPEFIVQDEEQRVCLTALPLYHIFSLMANGLFFYHIGAHNVLVANPRDIKGLVKTLSKYKFHGIDGVNTLFKALLANPDFSKIDFSKLSFSLGGGMAIQKEVAEEWKKVTGCVMNQAYGLTEASPAVSINPYTNNKFNNSIGLPIPSTEVAILDDKKRQMPTGEAGNLFVRGPQVMRGYLNNYQATSKDLSLDGWLNTGDIAYLDKKGYIFIVDRSKDMINVSGFNVYPNEVEEVVDSHPNVYESGCIGVPDEHSGEAVKVFVVLNPGEKATAEEIIDYCRKKLTGYKTPDQVEFVKELPKTTVGKILRRELRQD